MGLQVLGPLGGYTFYELDEYNDAIYLDGNTAVQLSFSDYTPKNNKCFCYPYNYCLLTNNVGNQVIYKYEDFYDITNNTISFDIEISLSVGCSARLVPHWYKNMAKNYDESIPLAKYPTCAWSSDAFINWLTENAVNIGSSIVLGTIGAVTSPATGGMSLLATATAVANLIGQFNKASLLPSIEKGSNDGDVNFSSGNNTFTFRKMRVKTEYLKIIDDYFTRFGYKVNRLKIPNITGRTYWNYVQIGQTDEIGYGDVPTKYMELINSASRKGVTIWHNNENVGNFALNNTIVS